MIELNNENVNSEIKKITNNEKVYEHFSFLTDIPVSINATGNSRSTTRPEIAVHSPMHLRLRVIATTGSHLILFKFNNRLYTFDDIVPKFLEHFGRIFLIGDIPEVDEYHNLLFSNEFQNFNQVNGIYLISTDTNEYLFGCYLDSEFCQMNSQKFESLGFPSTELSTRLDEAAQALHEEFS